MWVVHGGHTLYSMIVHLSVIVQFTVPRGGRECRTGRVTARPQPKLPQQAPDPHAAAWCFRGRLLGKPRFCHRDRSHFTPPSLLPPRSPLSSLPLPLPLPLLSLSPSPPLFSLLSSLVASLSACAPVLSHRNQRSDSENRRVRTQPRTQAQSTFDRHRTSLIESPIESPLERVRESVIESVIESISSSSSSSLFCPLFLVRIGPANGRRQQCPIRGAVRRHDADAADGMAGLHAMGDTVRGRPEPALLAPPCPSLLRAVIRTLPWACRAPRPRPHPLPLPFSPRPHPRPCPPPPHPHPCPPHSPSPSPSPSPSSLCLPPASTLATWR